MVSFGASDSGVGPAEDLGGDTDAVLAEVFHGLEETPMVIGEGNGVISAKGPVPGEDSAEAGDTEPRLYLAADRTDLTLALRAGRPVVDDDWRKFDSTACVFAAAIASVLGVCVHRSVCTRRPAL